MYRIVVKRFFDFLAALLFLIILSPVFFLLIVGLWLFNDREVFFLQQRPGKNEKIFKIIKFKTMRDLYYEDGSLLPDMMRITKIGSFIRSTSLDELPQLINVLIGQMSLIGPRPLLIRYLSLYSETQKRRHNVRPGITGWTQINGRNTVAWPERFKMDVWYVDNISFLLDLKILCLTFVKVLKRSDINASENATMKPFKGNNL